MTAIEQQHPEAEVEEVSDDTALEVPTVGVRRILLGNRWAFLLDVVLPLAGFQLLIWRGVSAAAALSATAIFPVAGTLGGWVRERRTDVLGIISLLFIAAGLIASLVTGDPRLNLMKGSLLTGAFGLAFLGSLFLPRPLAFYLGRQMMTGGEPALIARWDALWQYRGFREGNRVVSTAWGCGLLIEAGLRIVLALGLPTSAFMLVWPLVSYGIYAALLAWTVAYARR